MKSECLDGSGCRCLLARLESFNYKGELVADRKRGDTLSSYILSVTFAIALLARV